MHGDLVLPYIFYVLTNILPVIAGSVLVTYVEPVAAGSGIYDLIFELKTFSNPNETFVVRHSIG